MTGLQRRDSQDDQRSHAPDGFSRENATEDDIRGASDGGGDKVLVDFDHNQKLLVSVEEGDKMVAWDDGKHHVSTDDTNGQKIFLRGERDDKETYHPTPPASALPDAPKSKRICGLRRRWFYTVLISILVLAIGLGAGLGVGLSSSDAVKTRVALASDHAIGGELNGDYYSKTGAFNGTGIAFESQSFDNGTVETLLYYQHYEGDIRWMRRRDLHGIGWEGGSAEDVVASDARNNTPLSAISYTVNNVSTWHMFYIDNTNILREKVRYNTTNKWLEGSLSDSSLKVYDSDMIGMYACWYGALYNDTDYTTTQEKNDKGIGIHLWYPISNTTFTQLGWRLNSTWTPQRNWTNANTHAGLACYSWASPPTTTWLMYVSNANLVEIWGKNTDAQSTVGAPLNVWTNTTPDGLSAVHPSSSLINVNLLYTQELETSRIKGYDVSFEWKLVGGVRKVSVVDTFEIEEVEGIPGTRISATALPNEKGGTSLWLGFQGQGSGNNITAFTRDLTGGNWTRAALPVSGD